MVAMLGDTRALLDKTSAVVHEMFLDHACLCHKRVPQMEDLGEASGIITRVVQNLQRLQKMAEKQTAAQSGENPLPGLTPELREQLERDLKLVG